jgi:methionyl-tRNA synthetase
MGLSNLPPDVDNSDPHFHVSNLPDQCPDCDAEAGDDVYCESCGAVLDPDEADAIARDEAYERGEL